MESEFNQNEEKVIDFLLNEIIKVKCNAKNKNNTQIN